jgi:hypothetical protein
MEDYFGDTTKLMSEYFNLQDVVASATRLEKK